MSSNSTSRRGSDAINQLFEFGDGWEGLEEGPTSGERPANQLRAALGQRNAFERDGYVMIAFEQLFADFDFRELQSEVGRLAETAVARDFTMRAWGTPRKMSALGGREIRKRSPMLVALYENEDLRGLVSELAGRPIYTYNDPNEWSAINWENGLGATHGFHLDDSPLVLTICTAAPDNGRGGEVEIIKDWRDLCAARGIGPEDEVAALVEDCRNAGLVTAKTHSPGDAYLLRAGQHLHRVTPLTDPDARRATLTFGFEFQRDVHRIAPTGALLYETPNA